MKTGELVSLLAISKDTVRLWADRYDRFLSRSAKLEGGNLQRIFTEEDVLVINTIRELRSENRSWEEIEQRLDEGYRFREFPHNALLPGSDRRTIPVQQAEVSVKASFTVAERDAALARVQQLEGEMHQLKEHLKAEQEGRRADVERLMREVAQLNRELGAALARLEDLKD